MKLNVGVSNRHVHLTEEVYNYLFDNKKIEKAQMQYEALRDFYKVNPTIDKLW